MRSCKDAKPYTVIGIIGVIGVIGIGSALSQREVPIAFLIPRLVVLDGGTRKSFSTLLGLNRNKLVVAQADLMFLRVNALSLIGLYKEVKYSLPITFIPPRFKRLTQSRQAVFKGVKTPTLQGQSLQEVQDSRRYNTILFAKQNSSISSVSCVPKPLQIRIQVLESASSRVQRSNTRQSYSILILESLYLFSECA